MCAYWNVLYVKIYANNNNVSDKQTNPKPCLYWLCMELNPGDYPKRPDQNQFRKSFHKLNFPGIEPGSSLSSANRWITEVVDIKFK